MYRAKCNADEGIFKGVKKIADGQLIGYKKVNSYFVDNSGFGTNGEMAMTKNAFLSEVKSGYFYGITEVGQFQVYIGEYIKTNRKTALAEMGISKSKLLHKHLRRIEYTDGKIVYRLYDTDIITIKDGKTVLNSGGYHTTTTKRYINMYSAFSVFQKNYNWYVKDGDEVIDFVDGIEL
jgi:hypothetical protein